MDSKNLSNMAIEALDIDTWFGAFVQV